jgi:rubrerythrin
MSTAHPTPPSAAVVAGWQAHRQAVHDILAEVSYPGYRFEVGGTDRTWIRAHFEERCSVSGGEPARQSTRRWYISEQACRNEVVQTALKCVLTSVEHEARERFKYRGKAIFGPHFDVDALHRICADKELDYRGKTTSHPPSLEPIVQRCGMCGHVGTLTDDLGQCPICHWDELRPHAPGSQHA